MVHGLEFTQVKSIDDEIYKSRGLVQNNEVQVKDRIASEQAEPSMLNEKNSLRSELRNAMQHLSEREAQIVEMRFGLTSGAPMTLEEIGVCVCVCVFIILHVCMYEWTEIDLSVYVVCMHELQPSRFISCCGSVDLDLIEFMYVCIF